MKKWIKYAFIIFVIITISGSFINDSKRDEINLNVPPDNTVSVQNENNDKVVNTDTLEKPVTQIKEAKETKLSLKNIPKYSGKAYAVVNSNVPFFTQEEHSEKSFEYYSALDSLGRCSFAYAVIGKDLMPTKDRESIGQVKPAGWHTVKYDFVDGKYLYNRCHLIGFQLTGENANERNLITGTRYLNVEGMLPFENMVADYIKETNNHVLYRVTPIYTGTNLIADGILMEALSVEDNGEGISFNVYCYNVQPGVEINYATGKSQPETIKEDKTSQVVNETSFILNTNTKRIHNSTCSSAKDIKESNKKYYEGSLQELLNSGYNKCKNCF